MVKNANMRVFYYIYFIIWKLQEIICKCLFHGKMEKKKQKKILISQSIPSNHHQISKNQPTTNLPTTQTTTILAQTQPLLLHWPLKPTSIDHIPQHSHHHNTITTITHKLFQLLITTQLPPWPTNLLGFMS